MRRFVFVLTALAGSAIGALAAADDKGQPDQAEIMKRLAPSEMHKVLDAMKGKWIGKSKMWMQPGAPPTESTSKGESNWIFGGRYIETKVTGDFMGMPFEGRGHYGYDNMGKKFVASWIDNMGTGIILMDGVWDPAAKTLTWNSEMIDPFTSKKCKMREVDKFIDANHWTMTTYQIDADGKESKAMEISLTRAPG